MYSEFARRISHITHFSLHADLRINPLLGNLSKGCIGTSVEITHIATGAGKLGFLILSFKGAVN